MKTVERKQTQKIIKNTNEIFKALKEFIDLPETTTDVELILSAEVLESKVIIKYLEITE